MLAYDVNDAYEIIEGEKFMSPTANINHHRIIANLMFTIGVYASTNKLGYAFADNMDVHFPDGSLFRPDFSFVSAANGKIVTDNATRTIYGVPDMVVEVFSRATMRRDTGIKKEIYERNGVKEYWMIDPWRESVEVYLLREGKYFLDEEYQLYDENEWSELTDEERAAVKLEVPVNVLDGFSVKVKNVFGWFIE